MRMMKLTQDTIAAQSTVSGEGGIAIIRISGPDSIGIIRKVFRSASGREPEPRQLQYGHVVWQGEVIDEVMAVLLPGRHTYTAEDMAEIQCHGSQFIVNRILSVLMECGARLAEPGEFSYRAFINGRIDLTQAEAVMRLIHSSGERSRRSAMRQMDGAVSREIRKIQAELANLSAGLAAYIDFPDEVDEAETADNLHRKCLEMADRLERECSEKKGRIEDEGIYVALCGKPNAGKSSLLNKLVGQERAIVTEIPGTTRDILRESVMMNGIRFTLTDTAGLRETDNPVEKIGVERAREAIDTADVRILLIDSSEMPDDSVRKMIEEIRPDLILISKEDISRVEPSREILQMIGQIPFIQISAYSDTGVEALKQWLCDRADMDLSKEAVFSQTRHVEAAKRAASHLRACAASIENEMPLDLVNIDLMAAMEEIGQVTGENATEAVIDRVFSQFCVGK